VKLKSVIVTDLFADIFAGEGGIGWRNWGMLEIRRLGPTLAELITSGFVFIYHSTGQMPLLNGAASPFHLHVVSVMSP
jgi:hypothetical protein